MDVRRILDRIRASIREGSYLVPPPRGHGAQQTALEEIAVAISSPDVDPDAVRLRIHRLHAAGRIDRVMLLSALGVLAASPAVRDYAEASRLAGQQELVALEEGGPLLEQRRASADRHRGVLAYLLGRYEVALDWFSRALKREASAENLGNVLATLLRLGELDEAQSLHRQAAQLLAPAAVAILQLRIDADDDLIRLRSG